MTEGQQPEWGEPPTEAIPAPAKQSKRRRWPWIVGILVAFVLGIGVGASGNNNSTTTTAAASKSTVVDTKTATQTVTQSAAAPVTVTAPPSTVTYSPPPPPGPATTFGDGTYVVGKEIQAGTYHTDGGSGCYWERESDTTGGADSILANDNASGPVTVTIQSSDAAFKSENCGTWTKTD